MARVVKKLTCPLGGRQADMVMTTYTTGAAVAPASNHVSMYADLDSTETQRRLEFASRMKELISYIREIDYGRRISTATRYFIMTYVTGKKGIVTSTTNTDIGPGEIAIGIHTSVVAGSRGSLLLDVTFKRMLQYLKEKTDLNA
jgi:hypothetical protein